ncbi:MAG TPA: AAA family ATPase, partial [Ktedonobacterales bacterium]|nr:AAA family ATPase [Ktedonobacterales bacterium]
KADGFSNVIRPYLERKDLVLLGETTQESYTAAGYGARALADDTSLLKLFTVIPVEEPAREATKSILRAVARDLERSRKVNFDAAAIDRALELTRRFLPYQAFPGKATRLLEEAAKGLADDASNASARPTRDRRVTVETISAGFSRLTGLPEKIISDTIPLTQDEIVAYFNEHIVGQEEAVAAVADVVTLVKAELNDPGRPLGVLFFVGPTGVGKTELAKTLAEYLFGSKEKLIRFDMSEYKTYASLPDLLNNLTERQRRQSFSVLLLDEIEKAGPFVFDLFLQAFDDARLTDASGRSVDLRNTIIILTSNIGTDLSETRGIGFFENRDRQVERRQQVVKAVETYFRPEFINRLDKILVFQPLGREQMRHIARRELNRALLREGVLRRNILLDFREEVLDVLLTHGFSPTYGARPLQRAIKDYVLLPLARRIAAQPAAGEQLLELFARDGMIDAAIIPVTAAAIPEEVAETVPTHGGERVSIADAETGRERRMDLRQLAGEVVALRERIEAQIAGERYEALQTRSRALLEETAGATFWEDPQRSRYVLATIYHGERVTDRFVNLRNRAERLEETAKMIRRHGDAVDVARLASNYELLSRDVTLAELELLAYDTGGVATDTVFLRITPFSAPRAREAGEWPETLHAMYTGWATRKGYEVATVSAPGQQPFVLRLHGPNLGTILSGEEGLHKLQRDAEEPAGRGRANAVVRLARVEILPVRDSTSLRAAADIIPVVAHGAERDGKDSAAHTAEFTDPATRETVQVRAEDAERIARELLVALLGRAAAGTATAEEIARVYHLGRTQYVRDPRTGLRLNRPREVLAGALDSFLVAYLNRDANGRLEEAGDDTAEMAPVEAGRKHATREE